MSSSQREAVAAPVRSAPVEEYPQVTVMIRRRSRESGTTVPRSASQSGAGWWLRGRHGAMWCHNGAMTALRSLCLPIARLADQPGFPGELFRLPGHRPAGPTECEVAQGEAERVVRNITPSLGTGPRTEQAAP